MRHPKLLFLLIIAFILMTVVGTLSHELGHCITARILGYETKINYQSCRYENKQMDKFILDIQRQYKQKLNDNIDLIGKKEYSDLIKKKQINNLIVLLAGPLQTMLTGSVGFLLLLYRKKTLITNQSVRLEGWVYIFATLFWSRQLANAVVIFASFIMNGSIRGSSDEIKLAKYFFLPELTILIATAIIALFIIVSVIIILPKRTRITFIVAGTIGGTLGYYLWLIKFGKYILP